MFTELLIKKMVDVFGDWLVTACKAVVPINRGRGAIQRYAGASDFWFDGADRKRVVPGERVLIKGLISRYAPFTPGHPRARPGRNPRVWAEIEQKFMRFSESTRNAYSAFDSALYGDGVVVLSQAHANMAYLGIYDLYGASDCSVPAFADLSDKRLHRQLALIAQPGSPALVEGVISLFPGYYRNLGINAYENEQCPCFGINIHKVRLLKESPHCLYADLWMTTTTGKFIDSYGDLASPEDKAVMLNILRTEYERNKGEINFIYDPTEIVGGIAPSLNQRLNKALEV
jgi:hypothetical protein